MNQNNMGLHMYYHNIHLEKNDLCDMNGIGVEIAHKL